MKRIVPFLWFVAFTSIAFLVVSRIVSFATTTARAESARLRAALDSAEVARDSVTRWADSVLAERDTAIARERRKVRVVLASNDSVVHEAKVVVADTAATPDTLRATITSLLWSNAQVVAAFHAHLASDSTWMKESDAAWQKKVDAEVTVSDGLRALNANTESRLRAETARGRRDRLVFGALGALAGWALKP